MAKTSGLGWTTFSVDDAGGAPVVIKNDITNLQFATPRGVQDVTGIDKSAMERLLLLADLSYTLNGVVNPTVSHTVFKTVPSTSVARTVTNVVAAQTLAAEVLFTDYNHTRGADGAWTWSAPGVLADGNVPAWS
jgi:hypothetical protein